MRSVYKHVDAAFFVLDTFNQFILRVTVASLVEWFMVVRVRGRVTLRRRYVTVYTANIFVRAETRVQGSLLRSFNLPPEVFLSTRVCVSVRRS